MSQVRHPSARLHPDREDATAATEGMDFTLRSADAQKKLKFGSKVAKGLIENKTLEVLMCT